MAGGPAVSGPLIHVRVLRPDGSEAASGPLQADVIADVVKAEGVIWHVLQARGWRLESVGGAG